MSKPRLVLIILLVVALLAGAGLLLVRQLLPTHADAAALDPDQARIAQTYIGHLDAGRWTAAHAMLAPVAADKISAEQLKTIWSSLPDRLGGAKSRGDWRGERIGDTAITTLPMHFGLASLDVRISTDDAGRIDGFRLVPAQAPPLAPAVLPTGVSETTLAVAGLPATLTLPAGSGRFPAAVLVHGSGPHDRDQTVGANPTFRDLAHGLASQGIATLRYEKRSKARPEDFANQAYTVDLETVDDAVAAIALLRSQTRIDPNRVFVIGHSQGALMAPRIGERAPDAAGLVLLAAPARPLQELVVEQVEYLAMLDGVTSDDEARNIAEIRSAADTLNQLADGKAVHGPLLLGLPEEYWRDLLAYDPVRSAQQLGKPMLILQGERDYQVTARDFERWHAAFANSAHTRLIRYPALNHLFGRGEGPASPQEYAKRTPFDAQVISDIAQWIAASP